MLGNTISAAYESISEYNVFAFGARRTGKEPLHYAISHEWTDLVKLCLEKGEDPHFRNQYGETLLHIAAEKNCLASLESMEILLAHGVNPNIPDRNGNTPLHVAAEWGDEEIVKVLLKAGANPKVENKGGTDPS